jgi:ferredoxin
MAGDETVAAVIERRTAGCQVASAMLFDPTRCIRCGQCASRCPTEAVKMEAFRFTEEVFFEKEG